MLAIFIRDLSDMEGTPVFASTDPEILRGLAALIGRRLGAAPAALRAVKPRSKDNEPDSTDGD